MTPVFFNQCCGPRSRNLSRKELHRFGEFVPKQFSHLDVAQDSILVLNMDKLEKKNFLNFCPERLREILFAQYHM
jgi:protein-tyrosine-phosphatase